MNPNEITSKDVSDWLQIQCQKLHENHGYARIAVELYQNWDHPQKASFSIYCGTGISSENCPSIEECFEKIAPMKPFTIAAGMRKQAAKLNEQAARIEAQHGIKS